MILRPPLTSFFAFFGTYLPPTYHLPPTSCLIIPQFPYISPTYLPPFPRLL